MSSTSSSSSSSSSYFNPAPRFEAWIEENAETKGWVAEIKDMYEASGSKLDFARAVFKQVGNDYEKLNSDENRGVLRDLAPKVVEMTDATVECNTDELVPIEASVLSTTELVKEVFSYLDFKTLGRCAQVNKQWNAIAEHPLVLKQSAYNSSFSNSQWKRCFGEEVLAGEEEQNDFASLPDNIGSILRSPCPAFLGKRVFETHVLFRMPRTVGRTADGQEIPLTLKTLGELATKYFPNTENNTGYRYIWPNIVAQHGDTPIQESCWMLMTRELLEGSRSKNFTTQQAMVTGLASDESDRPVYAVPKTLEATLGILTEYFMTTVLGTPEVSEGIPGTRLLNNDGELWSYTRCQEETESVGGRMWRNRVGGFALGGVHVHSNYDFDHGSIGVVGLRKF
jgi:hypothetical protein